MLKEYELQQDKLKNKILIRMCILIELDGRSIGGGGGVVGLVSMLFE